jgi:cell division protein FtsB
VNANDSLDIDRLEKRLRDIENLKTKVDTLQNEKALLNQNIHKMQSTNSILEIEKQRGIINEHEDSIHLLRNSIKLNENY